MEKVKFLFTRINVDDNHRDIIKIQADSDYNGMQKWLNTTYNTEDKVEMLFRTRNILVSKHELNAFLKDLEVNAGITEAFEWFPTKERWIKVGIDTLYDPNFPM